MFNRKFLILFFLLILSTSSIFVYFLSSPYCKSIKIISSINDFGTNHIKDCFSTYQVKRSVKTSLRDYPLLYNFVASIYSNTSSKKVVRFNLNDPANLEDIKIAKKDGQTELPSKIIGLSNQKIQPQTSYESFDELSFNEWKRSHADNYNSKFLDDDLINSDNIENLDIYWSFSTIKNNSIIKSENSFSPYKFNEKNLRNDWKQNIQVNPIFINGKLIFVSADWKIICLDILKKKILWELQSIFQPSRRGIAAYSKNGKDFLILPIGGKTYKINIETGKKVKTFGENGSINVATITSPIIDLETNEIIITNHANKSVYKIDLDDGYIKSHIALFDPKKRNWAGGSPWAGTAYDNVNKIIYIPTGNPIPSLYGVKRPGFNKGSSSIIALDLKEEKIIWRFQDVFHDLWDYDLAFPPILDDIKIGNKKFSVVVVVSKTGNAIILDRFSGSPIFDIDFVKVEKSSVEGEKNSTYQRKYTLPERLSEIEYTNKDYSKLNIESQLEIKDKLSRSRIGYFPPPSFDKDTIIFGIHGGGEWPGGSLNPKEDSIYVPINNYPWKLKPYYYSTEILTTFDNKFSKIYENYLTNCSSCHGKKRNGQNIQQGEKRLKYVPSLVGLTVSRNLKDKFKYKKFKEKHVNSNLNEKDFKDIKELFKNWDKKLLDKNQIKVESNGYAWSKFETTDGIPASNPPWGYVVKLNLRSGKIDWKTPVGYDLRIEKNKPVGTAIFGGTALNSGNVLFVTGTHDNIVYGINSVTGKIIWEYKMVAAGSAPPTLFKYQNKQYLVVFSSGGSYYEYKDKSSSVYIFTVKDN